MFKMLGDLGYSLNDGLAGIVRPGNIIQTVALGSDGKVRELPMPLVFGWAPDCFPGYEPHTSEFSLPQKKGGASAEFTIGAEKISRFLPWLRIETKWVSNYSLKVERVRLMTLAKGDVSGAFSEGCVGALRKAIDGGDKAEWFRVVLEAVVADELVFEVNWKANASAEARKSLTHEVGEALTRAGSKTDSPRGSSKMDLKIKKDDEKETSISATGFIILGYRARPIEAMYSETGAKK